MKIRKPNEQLQMSQPKKTAEQILGEKLDRVEKKLDKLFKVLDLKFTK